MNYELVITRMRKARALSVRSVSKGLRAVS